MFSVCKYVHFAHGPTIALSLATKNAKQKITITKRGTILERHTKIIIVIVIIIDENVIRSEYDTGTGTAHSDAYKV